MSIKSDMLHAIRRNGQLTQQEMVEALPSIGGERVKSNIYQLTHAKLIERVRDDVSGLPAYRLTKAGKQEADKEPQPETRRSAQAGAEAKPSPDEAHEPAPEACDDPEQQSHVAVADPVNHPAHYTSHPSGIEAIQITEHMGFCLGNAVKYIWRADLKADAIEDLKKARWYIDRELQKRGAA